MSADVSRRYGLLGFSVTLSPVEEALKEMLSSAGSAQRSNWIGGNRDYFQAFSGIDPLDLGSFFDSVAPS